MSNASSSNAAHHIYPAKYFRASPTYNVWVKLTIRACIHDLREVAGFEGQNVLFKLNHPIRFAYLVGIIASIDFLNEKISMVTLDDSSGICIDLVVRKDETSKETSATTAEGVYRIDTVESRLLYLNGEPLDIGTVVKAKGTFSKFRGGSRNERQLELKRLVRIKDTAEELDVWNATNTFYTNTLSRPWVLSQEEQSLLDAQQQREVAQQKLVSERDKLRKHQIAKRLERRERRAEQRRSAEEAEMNEGALI